MILRPIKRPLESSIRSTLVRKPVLVPDSWLIGIFGAYSEEEKLKVKSYGPELVQKGTFPNDLNWTGWGANWVWDGSFRAYYADLVSASIVQSDANMLGSIAANKKYRLKFTVASGATGVITFQNAGFTVTYVAMSNYVSGSYEIEFNTPADVGVAGLSIKGHTTGTTFYIDNVSVKEIIWS